MKPMLDKTMPATAKPDRLFERSPSKPKIKPAVETTSPTGAHTQQKTEKNNPLRPRINEVNADFVLASNSTVVDP
jgi:hypothetical protein